MVGVLGLKNRWVEVTDTMIIKHVNFVKSNGFILRKSSGDIWEEQVLKKIILMFFLVIRCKSWKKSENFLCYRIYIGAFVYQPIWDKLGWFNS